MKTFLTAAALTLVTATGAFAAGVPGPNGTELRTVEVTSPKDRIEIGQSTKTVTVGAPKEVSIDTLAPRDRARVGYGSNASVTVTTFTGTPAMTSNAR